MEMERKEARKSEKEKCKIDYHYNCKLFSKVDIWSYSHKSPKNWFSGVGKYSILISHSSRENSISATHAFNKFFLSALLFAFFFYEKGKLVTVNPRSLIQKHILLTHLSYPCLAAVTVWRFGVFCLWILPPFYPFPRVEGQLVLDVHTHQQTRKSSDTHTAPLLL